MAEPTPVSPSPTLRIDDRGVGWITFDDPERKVNVLTEAVMARLTEVIEETRRAAESGRVKAAVLRSGKPDTCIAGADVDAIAALEDPAEAERKIRAGQEIFTSVERLPVPTVFAIHGVCVGGGVELALACRHRVVSDSVTTRVGLPEVQLGILPAWGGTTRLPRLVGLPAALDLLLTGKLVDARKAHRIGFAGEILPAEQFAERVEAFALRALDLPPGASRPSRGLVARLRDDTAPGRLAVLAAARKQVMDTTGGHYPAPLKILEILRKRMGGTVARSLQAEASAAAELVVGSVSKNLVHVFRLREGARKRTGPDRPGARAAPVDALGVIGAGVMGGGIAQLAAATGIRVRMKDLRHDAITSGLKHARAVFDKAVERRKLGAREAAQGMERISGGLDWSGFAATDLVVEAVVERLDVKRRVLAELEGEVGAGCVLATNTSALSVDAMSEVLSRPERFCGMHFFNPVHRMPLVEVVRGSATAEDTIATVYALALRLGKVPVVVGDGPGFLVNRILTPYLNEAGWLLAEGVPVEAIDGAARAFGMPMGPLRLVDEVGIDVSTHAGANMHEALGARLQPAPPLVALGASGRLGRKGGQGFYRYEDGKEKGVDPSIYDALGTLAHRKRMPSEVIRRRLVLPMINEAARVLAEGLVRSAGDVDLGMIMGTGFPPFRGGLLRFADSLHPRGVVGRMRALEAEVGPRFTPAPPLDELARDDRGFYDAYGS